jgi:8-oxo-dGTP diphosphatase
VATEPRIRVSAILRWGGRILLCRHEKEGRAYWLLPGGGVNSGESLVRALHRELAEEVGMNDEIPVEGPVAIVDSIAPVRSFAAKHVVHIIFSGDLEGRSLEAVTSQDAAVRGHRLFDVGELDEIVLHPPIQRFLARWRPGDPVVYLGPLWAFWHASGTDTRGIRQYDQNKVVVWWPPHPARSDVELAPHCR